jgi:hypothetical protein
MEGVRAEHARQPLKAAINKNIIKGIGAFFIVTISLMLILALSTLHLTPASFSVHLPEALKVPDLKSYVNVKLLNYFLFFDAVLALVLVDAYLRRRKAKQALRP